MGGWNSTSQAAWYVRHAHWACLCYVPFVILWRSWITSTILLLILTSTSFMVGRSRLLCTRYTKKILSWQFPVRVMYALVLVQYHVYATRYKVSLRDVVVVFTLNRSFYSTTSAVPPVSFLILHPREIQILWSQWDREKPKVAKESR